MKKRKNGTEEQHYYMTTMKKTSDFDNKVARSVKRRINF